MPVPKIRITFQTLPLTYPGGDLKYELEFAENTTINNVKQGVKKHHETNTGDKVDVADINMCTVPRGRLEDKTLKDYHVKDGDTIWMVFQGPIITPSNGDKNNDEPSAEKVTTNTEPKEKPSSAENVTTDDAAS